MRASLALAMGVFGLALAVRADEGTEGPKGPDKVEGTWAIVQGYEGGKPVPKERIRDNRVIISRDTIRILDKDKKQTWLVRYKLDPAQDPKAIAMTVAEGEGKGQSAEGIYHLEGNTLKLCYALPGHPRPKTFAPTQTKNELLFTMKRVKE